jgi:uncharacterized protein
VKTKAEVIDTESEKQTMLTIIRAVVLGTLGGALCFAAGVPAAWLAGSLIATIIAIYSHQKLELPEALRTLAFILLGVQTGTSVNADTVARAAQWPLSIVCLAVTVSIIVWACTIYYNRIRKWDMPTSLFASLPGALSLVILLASNSGADMRRVTIAQCIRLFFLIAALPAIIKFVSPLHVIGLASAQMGSIGEIIILVVSSTAAGLVLDWLKIPAGLILGPALVSAGLGLSGVVHGAAPDSILVPANIILGVMIGLRFSGISLTELRASLADGFAGFVIAMAIAVIGAVATSYMADLPIALTLLAFAPGGLEAMTIMAFALNLDPAYVAAHQVARYIGMVLFMPAVTAYVLNRGISTEEKLGVKEE